MTQQYALRFQFESLRSVAFGGVGAAYAVLGSVLANPARIIIITNTTNESVVISDDGTNDKLIIPTASFKLIDVSANRSSKGGLYFKKGLQFYQKRESAAPTSGNVYLEVLFAT